MIPEGPPHGGNSHFKPADRVGNRYKTGLVELQPMLGWRAIAKLGGVFMFPT